MITFRGMNDLKVDLQNKDLLRKDLTGCQLLLHMKNDSVCSEYIEDWGSERLKKAWRRNTDGNPTLSCFLINAIESGSFSNSSYEAIVLDEQDEIVSWETIVIDSQHRDAITLVNVINIRIFGFSTFNFKITRSKQHSDAFLTSTDDFNLMILEKCSFRQLSHLRRLFELSPIAGVYNSLKIDSVNSERIQSDIDHYEKVIADLRELRIEEQISPKGLLSSSTKRRYTEITHWQEFALRMKVRELRKEQFKNLRGFIDLEDFWFDQIRGGIVKGKISVEEGQAVIFRGAKIINRSELSDGDIFIVLTKAEGAWDGNNHFSLSLAICEAHNHLELYGEKYDRYLYSLRVNANEERFDHMNFAKI